MVLVQTLQVLETCIRDDRAAAAPVWLAGRGPQPVTFGRQSQESMLISMLFLVWRGCMHAVCQLRRQSSSARLLLQSFRYALPPNMPPNLQVGVLGPFALAVPVTHRTQILGYFREFMSSMIVMARVHCNAAELLPCPALPLHVLCQSKKASTLC